MKKLIHCLSCQRALPLLLCLLLRCICSAADTNIPAVSDIVGKWECITPGQERLSLEIDYDPADPKHQKLVCRGAKKEWKFDPKIDIAATGMIWLSRFPAADEMRKDEPDWARKEMQGKLEWRLRLTASKKSVGPGENETVTLKGQFFRGKMTVKEKNVRLATGPEADVEPIDLEFQKQAPDLVIDTLSKGDSSHVVTQTDGKGKVKATALIPPTKSDMPVLSTTDPATGITTTTATASDGSKVVTKTEIQEEGDAKRITATSENGQSETVVKADGTITVTRTAHGSVVFTATKSPNGAVSMVEINPDGSKTATQRDPNGKMVTEKWDKQGNKLPTVTRAQDGSETLQDEQGNTTKISTDNAAGTLSETTTDNHGNTTSVKRDANGEVIERKQTGGAKKPGQEYYETVLGGTDKWDSLPRSYQERYARSERLMRDTQAMQKLRAEQAANDAAQDAAIQKAYQESKAQLDAALAAIQAEQNAADRKAAKQEAQQMARDKRQLEIEESRATAKRLQREYDEAVRRGAKEAEKLRIIKLQDDHHEASMKLLSFNDEEMAASERKQALRDRIIAEIEPRARAKARSEVELDMEQVDPNEGNTEAVTNVTQWISLGSAMQQETKKSTRIANFGVAFGMEKKQLLQQRLNNPKTTSEEREIVDEMLKLADAQITAGYEQLCSNRNLATAGYAFDIATLAVGKGVQLARTAGSKFVTATISEQTAKRIINTAARAADARVGELATKGTLAATEKIAGKEAAQALAARSAAAADAARAAAALITNSKAGQVLSRGAGGFSSAQAESAWLKRVVEAQIKGAAIGAGAEIGMTGEINLKNLVISAVAGGFAFGSLDHVTEAIGTKTVDVDVEHVRNHLSGEYVHPSSEQPKKIVLGTSEVENRVAGPSGPPSDPYDVEAWKKYYEQNPGIRRSVGAAAIDEPDVNPVEEPPEILPSNLLKETTKLEGKPVKRPKDRASGARVARDSQAFNTKYGEIIDPGYNGRLRDDPPMGHRFSHFEVNKENLNRMLKGKPPIAPDGYAVELHHRTRGPKSRLDEYTRAQHDELPLHEPDLDSLVDREEFNMERARHWISRAREIVGIPDAVQ